MALRVKSYSLPLFALALALAACNSGAPGANGGAAPASGGNSAAAGSSSSAGGGVAVISADDKPHDVMMKAVRAQLDARSYRAHVTTSMGGGPDNKMVIEYVAPDRYRMVSEAQGGRQEFVIVGGAAYIKGPNGQWVKSPVGVADIIKQFRDPKVLEDMAKTTDIKLVGPDMVDGTPTLVYEYTQNNVMGMNMKSTARTWLAVSDGMPRKTEAEGEYDGKKTKTLVTMSDYNSDIKIEAPIK
jgi:hypothetical protein